jgi:hypothetical protein
VAFRIFNWTGDSAEDVSPITAFAKKIGRMVSPIFDAYSGSQPQQVPRNNDPATDMSLDYSTLNVVPHQWKVAQDRKSMYKDIENMDMGDELVSKALDIIANNCVDFLEDVVDSRVRFKSNDPEVATILGNMSQRLDLDQTLFDIARECAAHGSIFREVVLDRISEAKPFIANFKQTIPYHIWPKTTDRGDKVPGWLIKLDQDIFNGGGQALSEWQIVPFIYGARKGYLSVPPLASARSGFQRLAKIEDGMAVARLIRAYDKMVHKIPVGKEWEKDQILQAIRLYKQAITKRNMETTDGQMNSLDNPLDVQTDFYVPDDGTNRGGVEMLRGDNINLGNLNDVQYAREKLLARLGVPVEMLQLMSLQKTHIGSRGGGMSPAQVQFAKTLRSMQAIIRRGLSRLCDIELMMQCPEKFATGRSLYTIELCDIDTADPQEDAQLLLTMGQACVYFLEAFGALPPEFMAAKFMQLTPDQQEMMQKFLDTDGQTILKARVDALKNEALAPLATKTGIHEATNPPGGSSGSGNNNKSRASRTTEQKGGKTKNTQGMSRRLASEFITQEAGEDSVFDIDSLVDLFADLQQAVNSDLTAAGIAVPEVGEFTRSVIRKNLQDIVHC